MGKTRRFAVTRQRLGPNQKQVQLCIDKDLIADFDTCVGRGNRSRVIRDMMREYVKQFTEGSDQSVSN